MQQRLQCTCTVQLYVGTLNWIRVLFRITLSLGCLGEDSADLTKQFQNSLLHRQDQPQKRLIMLVLYD
jgi:hypothetical protein